MGSQDPFAHLRDQSPLPIPNPDYQQSQEIDPFAHLRQPEERPNVFGYIGSVMEGAGRALLTYYTNPENDSPDQAAMRYALNQVKEDGRDIVVNDFIHMFGKTFDDISSTFSRIKEDPKEFVNAIKEQGVGFFANEVAMAFVQPIGDLIEADVGVSLSADVPQALTGEERATRIKNGVAFIASLGLAKGLAHGALRSSIATERAAVAGARVAGASTKVDDFLRTTALRTGSYLSRGNLGNAVMDFGKATAIGSAAGATYSTIAFANEEDQLAQVIMDAVVFAPVGMAFDAMAIRGYGKQFRSHTEAAKSLAITRQVQATMENTVHDVLAKTGAVMTANTALEALIASNELTNQPLYRIPGVQVTNRVRALIDNHRSKAATDLAPTLPGYELWDFIVDEDKKLVDLLVIKNDTAGDFADGNSLFSSIEERRDAREHFTRLGVLPDELVSHNGKDYIARSGEGRKTAQQAFNEEVLDVVYATQQFIQTGEVPEHISFDDWVKQQETQGRKFAKSRPRRFEEIYDEIFQLPEQRRLTRELGFLADQQAALKAAGMTETSPDLRDVNAQREATWKLLDELKAKTPTFMDWWGSLSKAEQNKYAKIIAAVDPIDLLLEDMNGQRIRVPREEIRHHTTLTQAKGPVLLESGYNLKGAFEQELRRNGSSLVKVFESLHRTWIPADINYTTLSRQAKQIVQRARTGQPVSLIAFRSEGKGAIVGTGRFYSAFLDDAIGYAITQFRRHAEPFSANKAANNFKITRLNFSKPFVSQAGRNVVLGELERLHPNNIDRDLLRQARAARRNVQGGGKTHEIGYQIADKIIAKLMLKLGYDGIIYGGGGEVVDLRGMDPKTGKLPARIEKFKGSRQATFAGVESFARFMNTVYDNFRRDLFEIYSKPDSKTALELKEKNKPVHDFMQAVPQDSFDFNKAVKSLAMKLGMSPDQVPALRRELHNRIINDLTKKLPAEERALVARARAAAGDVERIKQELDSRTLVRHANSNGMFITREDGGRIIIKDLQSGKELHRTLKFSDAMDFINMSGQAIAWGDDGGGGLPPIAGDLHTPMGGSPNPFDYVPDLGNGKFTSILDTFNTTATFLTRNREIFISIDNKFGTKLFSKVFDTTQEGRKRANALIRPMYDRLQKIDDRLRGWSAERRERVTAYIETMSPDEVISNYLSRKMHPEEIGKASEWFANDVDIDNVFKARRLLKNVDKEMKTDPRKYFIENIDPFAIAQSVGTSIDLAALSPADLASWLGSYWDQARTATRTSHLKYLYNLEIDRAAHKLELKLKDIEALRDMDAITSLHTGQFSLGATVRLMRAMKGSDGKPEMSRAAFAAHHKMPLEDIEIASQIEKMYNDLATEFKIDPKDRLGNYTTHARLYNNDNINAALRDHGASATAKSFYAEMIRTGEINPYELDPVLAMQQYIKAGYDAQYFNKMYNDAREGIRQELRQAVIDKRMPVEAVKHAKQIADNYLSDIRGHADAGRLFTQAAVNNLFDKLGWKVSFDVRNGIVNYLSSTMEAGAQGLRMAAGIRDLTSGLIVSHMRFGTERTIEALRYGIRGLDGVSAKNLRDMGIIPESGIVTFSDPAEFAGGAIGRTRGLARRIDQFNQMAFKVSMQQNVYRLMHAGHYLSTSTRADAALTKLVKGDYTKFDVAEDLLLRKYDAPIVEQFWKLVDENRHKEASRFLGIQTGQDMVGVYGLANHPAGWNTNVGRLWGQFGQWSVWFRSTLMRELSRGSWGDRAISGARFAASQSLIMAAGSAMGLDLIRWMPLTGLLFFGGPSTEAAESVTDMLSGNEYVRQRAQRSLLSSLRLLVPGGFFARDIEEALKLAEDGDDRALFRAIGVPVKEE